MADRPAPSVPLSGRRPRILHLSADFPDAIDPAKTEVIARLIALVADDYDHQVLSLNRRTPTASEIARLPFGAMSSAIADSVRAWPHGACLTYPAPPKGLLHLTMLRQLARWIAVHVAAQSEPPDLVIGHKLTVEGVLAYEVARQLGIPFAITIQGNTDEKILGARPDLKRQFARIYHEAACVFSFAPWARDAVARRLGSRTGPTLDMPCPTVLDTIRTPLVGGNALISVFHLRNHKIKNLAALAKAQRVLATSGCPAALHVIGGGSPVQTATCQALIAKAHGMTLAGPRSQGELGAIMNGAIALVMPSRRESFGLVFIEALFAGLPIIYPKGASIDGYFDGLPFAVRVGAKNPGQIAEAMRHVIANEADIKRALAGWQDAGGLARFTRTAIAATFDDGLKIGIMARDSESGAASKNRATRSHPN